MNIREHRFLLSERTALNSMIAHTQESDVLGRMSLYDRLRAIEAELEAYGPYSSHLVKASVTFQGSPVVGSLGIDAVFGLDAASAFVKAVRLVGASIRGTLQSAGRVPRKQDCRLLITGIALGSFGFQLEDASQQLARRENPTPVEDAIVKVKAILEASVESDEHLMHVIEETNQRALNGVRAFLKKMADNNAVCALEYQGEVFRFRDAAQVRRSERRLSLDNVKEENITVVGRFIGYLPRRPQAQFQVTRTEDDVGHGWQGEFLTARVAPSVAFANDINNILNREVRIGVRTRRVGSGTPSYLITELFSDEVDWRVSSQNQGHGTASNITADL